MRAKLPDKTHNDIASMLGSEWRGMDPGVKAKYEARAKEDHMRWEKEMDVHDPEWRTKHPILTPNLSSSSSKKKRKRKNTSAKGPLLCAANECEEEIKPRQAYLGRYCGEQCFHSDCAQGIR